MRINQYASQQETYNHPANKFVAEFIGSPAMNFLPAQKVEGGVATLTGNGFTIKLLLNGRIDTVVERVTIASVRRI